MTENRIEVSPEDLARELGASNYAPETAGRMKRNKKPEKERQLLKKQMVIHLMYP